MKPKPSSGTFWNPHDASVDNIMPAAHGGLRPWPSAHKSTKRDLASPDSDSRFALSPASSQRSESRDHLSTSTLRSYYDAQRQPLGVSQQTSASAIRDMGLRKSVQSLPRTDSDSTIRTRALKSAMKQPSPQTQQSAPPQVSRRDPADPPPKDRLRLPRLDFGNLLSRGSSVSNRSSQSSQLQRSPSSAHTVSHVPAVSTGPMRHFVAKWNRSLPQVGQLAPSPSRPTPSNARARASLLEDDMLVKAKTNIRRPPKGIKNWFDGVNISSDEEEVAPVELPANEALPSTFTQFDPARPHERAPRHTQYSGRGREPERKARFERRPAERDASVKSDFDTIAEHLLPIEQDRRGGVPTTIQREDSRGSLAAEDHAALKLNHRQKGEGRFAKSRLGRETLVSLSSSDDNELRQQDIAGPTSVSDVRNANGDAVLRHATAVDLRRPAIPPRKLRSPYSSPRNPHSDNLASRSGPVSLDALVASARPGREAHERSEERYDASQSHAVERMTPEAAQARRRASSRLSSLGDADDSNAALMLEAYSSDGSHLMAVTEEEMVLLEMMRNKRAAMQKNSFAEGYRLALKRENEQLMMRRLLAQKTAMQMLRAKEDQKIAGRGTDSDHDISPNLLSESRVRRLSALRQLEADRTSRLEQYLAMDTPMEEPLEEPADCDEEEGETAMRSRHDSIQPKANTSQTRRKSSMLLRTSQFEDDGDEGPAATLDERIGSTTPFQYESPLAFPTPPKSSEASKDRRRSQRSAASMSTFMTPEEEMPPMPSSLSGRFDQGDQTTLRTKRSSDRQDHYANSPDSSVAADLAAAASAGRRVPSSFLHPKSEHHSAEANSMTSQGSPSFSTSRASPLTPDFSASAQAAKRSPIDLAGSDDWSMHASQFSDRSFAPAASFRKSRPRQKHLPSALQVLADADRRQSRRVSVASVTSAGEDVLAAWADLGGSEGMLPMRRQKMS